MDDRSAARSEQGRSVRSPDGGQRSRRRLSVEERRDELIASALELFSHRAPENVSIEDVAEAAGASRALVYHYFGSKRELYLAALHSAAGQLGELLEPPAEGRPLDRLATALHRYFDFVEGHAAGFIALLRGGPAFRSGEVGEVIEGIRGLVMDRILAALGVERPGPILRITLRSWLACVETAGLDWLEHRDIPRADLERLLIDHNAVLLGAAGRYDPSIAGLLDGLAR